MTDASSPWPTELRLHKNKRTLTQEMVGRLEASFTDNEVKATQQFIEETLKALADHVGRPDLAAKITERLKGETFNG